MTDGNEVKRLAALARIRIDDTELEAFAKDFESIVAYIGQIEAVQVSTDPETDPKVRNVFREDTNPHESGAYTEKLTSQFPDREGDSSR